MLRKLGRLISCKDASRLFSQMQDGRLSMFDRMRIRLHLLWCQACRNFVANLDFLRAAMQRYRE